jgi:MYXO-CTERM domain-containing protein
MCTDGLCTDDPCAGSGAIACPPGGVCSRGQCQSSSNLSGYGPPPAASATSKSGCGCGGGDAGPFSLLLALLGLPLARRRRPCSSRTAAIGGLVALALLGGTACKAKKAKPNCETCGGDACVDLQASAGNCGSCGHACSAGQACASGGCVTAAAVPTITAVAPSQVSGNALLTVNGTGFTTAGTKLRVAGAVAQAELTPASLSATQLTATVDLSAAAGGTLKLQVVNSDRTVSNVYGVEVVTPTPQITGVAPGQGTAGTFVPVVVSGTSFTSNAVCVQKAGLVETVIVPTSRGAGGTSLGCTLDLTAVAPGFVDLYVQNENSVRSAAAAPRFQAVSPGAPVVGGVSPSTVKEGSEENLLVTGSAFEPGSSVEIAQVTPPGAWQAIPTSYVYSTALRASFSWAFLSPKGFTSGPYQLRVVNTPPGGTSAPFAFAVSPTAPVATNLTVVPATPVLGQTGVQLALAGAGFTPSCAVQVLPPGGTWRNAAAGSATSSRLQATADLNAAGDSAGSWNARASCPSGCGSPPCLTSALPFAVATNQASLVSVAPAGGAQGGSVPVTLTGANFLSFPSPGMTVTLDGLNPATATVTSPTSATATLSLAGSNTGVRLLRAVNAGAAPSNAIAFSVTPGTPAITAVAVADLAGNGACTLSSSYCSSSSGCSGTGCATGLACAVQQPKNVLVTVAGSSFGSGVSTVFVTYRLLDGSDVKFDLSTVLPAGSIVIGPTAIQVTLDSTAVLADLTYTMTVENAGTPAKVSNAVPFKVSSVSCP